MGGATNRVPAAATAYPHRNVEFIMNVHGRWDDATADDACIDWCRTLFDAAAPFAMGGAYVNFVTEDETERLGQVYGSAHDRLAAVKAAYDPTNLFRMNHNVAPASS
jgi:hypothetical protein